jgi:long-chain acyl-CoA synthetase
MFWGCSDGEESAMTFRNLIEIHRVQAERLGPRPALRFRRWGVFTDISWSEYRETALACAAALVDAGIQPGDRVGLVSENRVEWLLADMGIMTAGAVNVPAHAGLPKNAIARQMADARISWLIVSNAAQLVKAWEVRELLPELRGVVVFDRQAALRDAISWAAFLQRGRRALTTCHDELVRREKQIGPDDLATIMYTSGTTGVPKGVMLTHGNLVSNAEAMVDLVPKDMDIVLLSWLPLSHIFARTCDHYLSLRNGILVVLSESLDAVPTDLQEVQPTHLHGVPRFWEKMLAAAQATRTPDKTLRAMFGGRIRWMMSGGAPLPPAVCQVYRQAGLPLAQGYGLTETAPVLTVNRPERVRIDSVGQPLPGVEIRIAPDGEILARGPNIMKGYWNQPTATEAVLRDGWFHTGDMGRMDDEGFVYITGRKKELIVLSNGKKVAPTEVEAVLQQEPAVEQIVVYGDQRNYLTALIVPNWARVRQALPHLTGSDEELARHPEVMAWFQKRIEELQAGLSSWEQVKRFFLRVKPFSPESGELTVSLKLRREVIFEKHAADWAKLYEEANEPAP